MASYLLVKKLPSFLYFSQLGHDSLVLVWDGATVRWEALDTDWDEDGATVRLEAHALDIDRDEDGATVICEAVVLDADWDGWAYCNKEFPMFFTLFGLSSSLSFWQNSLVPTASINSPEANSL